MGRRQEVVTRLGCDLAGVDERLMFHGTGYEPLKSITSGGFDINRSECGGTFDLDLSNFLPILACSVVGFLVG